MQQKADTGIRYAAVFKSLFRTYAMLVFGVSRWQGFIRKTKNRAYGSPSGQFQAGKNVTEDAVKNTSAVKAALLVLLSVYIGGSFLFVFGTMAVNLYKALRPLGMPQLLFDLELSALFFFIFISSFLLTLSTYSAGDIEQTLRAMPIPSRIFFGAKFFAHCLPALLFSFCFLGTAAVVYGMYEHSPPYFYMAAFIGALLFPLPVVGLCYLIHIAVMRTTRIFKNKRLIMLITGLLGCVLAIGINYLAQSANALHGGGTAAFLAYRPHITSVIRYVLPIRFFADALAAESLGSMLVSFISYLLICAAVPAALIAALSGVYEKSLDGFDEKKLKKLSVQETNRLIRSGFVRRPVFTALILREIRMMNREPAYLLNGPFMIVLFPLIFGIMYLTGRRSLPPEAASLMQGDFGMPLTGVCGAFLGATTGIAATAVSRDAKNIGFIKSLPLPLKRYMQAKLAHAMLFSGIGSLIGTGGLSFVFSLGLFNAVLAFVIAISLALLCNLIALMLDTARPKLRWDTPAAAVKQNFNRIIMFFTDSILLIAAAVTAALTSMPQWLYMFCFAGVPLAVSGVAARFFWPYAERRINDLEL